MQGYKTYTAIIAGTILYLLQVTGNADWISEENVNEIINITLQLGLAVYAIYGRYHATREK